MAKEMEQGEIEALANELETKMARLRGRSRRSGSRVINLDHWTDLPPPPEAFCANTSLFLDFDGARVNTAIFGGPGTVTLSPLSAFLAKWGITRAQEDELIDAIVAVSFLACALAMTNAAARLAFAMSRDTSDVFSPRFSIHR